MTDKALPRVEMDDDCLNECCHADEMPMQNDRCTLRLVPNFIRVEYDDDGKMIYRGEEIGVGHFELSCPKRDAQPRFIDRRMIKQFTSAFFERRRGTRNVAHSPQPHVILPRKRRRATQAEP